jgi:hypothetical protein
MIYLLAHLIGGFVLGWMIGDAYGFNSRAFLLGFLAVALITL